LPLQEKGKRKKSLFGVGECSSGEPIDIALSQDKQIQKKTLQNCENSALDG
jgi:hypothetical protein